MLVRALANILILTQEQQPFVNQLIKDEVLSDLLKLLLALPHSVFEKATANTKRNIVLLYTHLLRVVIVCQSVDLKTLDSIK